MRGLDALGNGLSESEADVTAVQWLHSRASSAPQDGREPKRRNVRLCRCPWRLNIIRLHLHKSILHTSLASVITSP